MAKHVILEGYTFTPSTGVVVVNGKNIRREQLLLITNVTSNTVIYNFSDPSLGATAYVNSVAGTPLTGVNTGSGLEVTTITLAYSTAGMNATDQLAILVEETYTEMIPAEAYRDPVEKMRISTPQSLIDTDFEYGIQNTKWEQLNMLGNRPCAYYYSPSLLALQATPIVLANIYITHTGNLLASALVTGSTLNIAAPNISTVVSNGQPIFLNGTLDPLNADGWWIANVVIGNAVWCQTTANCNLPAVNTGTLLDPAKTLFYPGYFYSNSAIPLSTSTGGANGLAIKANASPILVINTFPIAHNLNVGDGFYLNTNQGTINGSWIVNAVPTSTTIQTVITTNGGVPINVPDVAIGDRNGNSFDNVTRSGTTPYIEARFNTLFPRNFGYIVHRAYDGGVQFTNLVPYHGYQVIRQTRRLFRYQSGKGIQFSTGSTMKPQVFVDGITASGTTATVNTRYPHGFQIGANVQIAGASDNAYNGIYTIGSVPNNISFSYTTTSRLDATGGTPSFSPAVGFPLGVSPYSWWGGYNRIGMYDAQNGFFYEFDGQQIYAVRRSSVSQMSGFHQVTYGSQTIVGTKSKYTTEVVLGDYIVLRGKSYQVIGIQTDNSMTIAPEYRGPSSFNCVMTKTVNVRYAQSSWNIDKMDGTGASRFTLDLTKLQMYYMDFTWYGAGAIRYGFKNNRGEVIYCHRIVNNNVNNEAYMRSGNLPARYESSTQAPTTQLAANLLSTVTTGGSITCVNTTGFPKQGYVKITNVAAYSATISALGSVATNFGGQGGAVEYIQYSNNVGNVLTVAARAQTVSGFGGGQTSAQSFFYTTGSAAVAGGPLTLLPVLVELHSPYVASTLTHWGSSVIMDGRFDDDKSIVFNSSMANSLNINTAGTRFALISIRIAPSVDNGTTGALGAKEVLNRMQLTLRQLDAFTNTTFKIDLILNATVATTNTQLQQAWNNVGGSSLAQVIYHIPPTAVVGGENVFGFFTSNNAVTQQDLTLVRDIGTGILGGGQYLNIAGNVNFPSNNTIAGIYPDGPDVISLCATALAIPSGGAAINARISWTEAQA